MNPIARKILSILAGIVTFIGLLVWSVLVGWGTIGAMLKPVGLASYIEGLGFDPQSVYYLKDHDVYTSLGFAFLSCAGGLSVSMLIWGGEVPKKASLALVWVSLLILLPLSAMNYVSSDAFSTRKVQAILNIPLAILGVLALVAIYDFNLNSRTGNIFRLFAAAFIMMQAVLIPVFYSTLWWLNFQNAISIAATRDLAPGWISAISGLGGFAFGVFKFMQSDRPAKQESKRKIWLPGDPK